jgi:hypothetical protein
VWLKQQQLQRRQSSIHASLLLAWWTRLLLLEPAPVLLLQQWGRQTLQLPCKHLQRLLAVALVMCMIPAQLTCMWQLQGLWQEGQTLSTGWPRGVML